MGVLWENLVDFTISYRSITRQRKRKKGNSLTEETRMTTFIKAKLKKSDDQTDIDNYRVVENNIE